MNRKSILEELERSKSLKRWEVDGVNLSDADMSGTDLTGARFSGCALRHVRFEGACLNEAVFVDCHVDGATFHGASLEKTCFEGCHGLSKDIGGQLRKGGAEIILAKRGLLSYGIFALALAVLAVLGYAITRLNPSRPETRTAPPAATAAATPITDPKILFSQGTQALAAKDYEKAFPYLSQAVDKAPDQLENRYQLALCLLEMGKYAEVREQIEAILARNPAQNTDISAQTLLADSYQREGKADSADKVFESIARKYAETPAILRGLVLNHANLRWKTRDFQGALVLLNQLLEMSTKDQAPGVYLLMGLVNKDLGKRKEAEDYFNKASASADDQPVVLDARVQLALLDIEGGHEDKAVEALTRLLEKGADAGQVYNALFQVYGKIPEKGAEVEKRNFLATLEKLFEKSPAHLANIHVEYGKLALEAGDDKTAVVHFKKVVELSKDPLQSAWASESIEEILRRDTQTPAPEKG